MENGQQGSAASVKAVEIGVAVAIFLFGALVVFDSYRVGAKWGDDGPQAGYFPLYVGLLICLASTAILGTRSGTCRSMNSTTGARRCAKISASAKMTSVRPIL